MKGFGGAQDGCGKKYNGHDIGWFSLVLLGYLGPCHYIMRRGMTWHVYTLTT
jgi:hypothetical protein